jgi:hypothetical protein
LTLETKIRLAKRDPRFGNFDSAVRIVVREFAAN